MKFFMLFTLFLSVLLSIPNFSFANTCDEVAKACIPKNPDQNSDDYEKQAQCLSQTASDYNLENTVDFIFAHYSIQCLQFKCKGVEITNIRDLNAEPFYFGFSLENLNNGITYTNVDGDNFSVTRNTRPDQSRFEYAVFTEENVGTRGGRNKFSVPKVLLTNPNQKNFVVYFQESRYSDSGLSSHYEVMGTCNPSEHF